MTTMREAQRLVQRNTGRLLICGWSLSVPAHSPPRETKPINNVESCLFQEEICGRGECTEGHPWLFSETPDTARRPQLHPQALHGEAEVPGGPRNLLEAFCSHKQPAAKDSPWGRNDGGGAGNWWQESQPELALLRQEEVEANGRRLLLPDVWVWRDSALSHPALRLDWVLVWTGQLPQCSDWSQR